LPAASCFSFCHQKKPPIAAKSSTTPAMAALP
jgi:hypothetical protein